MNFFSGIQRITEGLNIFYCRKMTYGDRASDFITPFDHLSVWVQVICCSEFPPQVMFPGNLTRYLKQRVK
ncbi:hypothetical protein DPMN_066529 [Dreissena polymorpha]|uniref:Uncharacterized protein n=1 Tax=Dreissena polymorpha TaxID=45954 RepID=A0A9D4BSY9_DREPO|nr:hypothetical protein DPMN_066529 [Dreissena polymorpha]